MVQRPHCLITNLTGLWHQKKRERAEYAQSSKAFKEHCQPSVSGRGSFKVKLDRKIKSMLEALMKYKVNIKKTDEGYAVWVPGLPGCWSQGKTENEALENIKDAIQAYLETVEGLSKNKKSRYIEVG